MKIADLFIKLGLKKEGFDRGIQDAEKKTSKFGSSMKKIGGVIAGAFAVSRIAAFGKELLLLGGKAEGVMAAFERIGGMRYLDDLKRATAGTVSELELMQRAVSAKNLGLPIENLASLFEFATKRAQDTGESVDYLVNSIVTGIGRKSPLILDNLGISAVQLREKLKGVGLQTASTAEVARAVGEIAADSMRESGSIIDTTAIKVQILRAAWKDLKTQLGLAITEADGFVSVLSKATGGFAKFIEKYNKLRGTGAGGRTSLLGAIFGSKEDFETIDKITQKIEETVEVEREHEKTIGDLKSETDQLKQSLEEYGISQTALIQNTLRQIEANEKLIKTLTTLNKTHGKTANFAPMQGAGTPGFSNATINPQKPSQLDDMTNFLKKNAELTKKYTAEMEADWNQFSENLGMLIEGEIVNFIDEFAYSLGQLAVGEINMKDFFNNILSQLSKFLGQLGKLLIAFGVAQLAFGESLKNIFNPASAPILIAAGVALVALSGAIGSMAKNASSGGSGGSAVSGQSLNIKSVDAQDRELVARVSGRDLEFVLAKRGWFNDRS